MFLITRGSFPNGEKRKDEQEEGRAPDGVICCFPVPRFVRLAEPYCDSDMKFVQGERFFPVVPGFVRYGAS